jgi:hypothetical protein
MILPFLLILVILLYAENIAWIMSIYSVLADRWDRRSSLTCDFRLPQRKSTVLSNGLLGSMAARFEEDAQVRYTSSPRSLEA